MACNEKRFVYEAESENPALTPFDFSGTLHLIVDEENMFKSQSLNGNKVFTACEVTSVFCSGETKNNKMVHMVRCVFPGAPDFFFDNYGRCLGFFDSLTGNDAEVGFVYLPLVRIERPGSFTVSKLSHKEEAQP